MAAHALMELIQMAPAAASVTISPHMTALASTVGGLIIGGTAAIQLRASGRVTGISGILHRSIVAPNALAPGVDEKDTSPGWRRAFMGGLLGAGAAAGAVAPELVYGNMADFHITNAGLVIGGVLVGAGTRLGSGCTSGHGVCGLARLSPRSAAAVATFMTTGMLTAWSSKHVDALRPILRGERPLTGAEAEEAAAVDSLLVDAAREAEQAAVAALDGATHYSPSLAQLPLGVAAPALVGAASAWLAYLSHRDSRAILHSLPAAGAAGDASASPSAAMVRQRAFADTAVSYGLGLTFGAGLLVSGMTDPMKVINFLDLQSPGGWDPSLAFVMGGAAGVALPVFQQVLRQQREWRAKVGLQMLGEGPASGGGLAGASHAGAGEDKPGEVSSQAPGGEVAPHPWLRPAYQLPDATQIDGRLLFGSALFGMGWGLSGVCPGPGLMAMASGSAGLWLWGAGLLAG